ncbi:MAG: hypothetical protein JJE25_10710 [Bacteroidia bacterium]|nr:hypothetical protein [Bacteroidia bacterium]
MSKFFGITSLTVLLVIVICSSALSQEAPKQEKKHGTFYFAWGYNKEWYSKSDIHFEDHSTYNYDFIVHDVVADDKPSLNRIFDKDFTVPQYNYRLGYYFNDSRNLGIEVSFDHTKYIVVHNQQAHVTGYIREEKFDKDTLLSDNFLLFEHTNGANFLMFNILKRQEIFKSKNGKHSIDAIAKAGAGMVIPKTDVTLFGERRDNVFHIAGYITGLETAVRWHFLKSFFLEPAVKGVFANYTNVLTVGSARANHHFFAAEIILTAGFQVDLGKKP